jgi:Clostripain family
MVQQKAWTILVWIAGDNNLTDYGVADLAELKQIGSTSKVDLVTQYDRGGRIGAKRYHLQKGTTLDQDEVADLGNTNTGDPGVAIDFFTWGISKFPAEKVMCVLWNHGSGIDETDIYARARQLTGRTTTGAGGSRRQATSNGQLDVTRKQVRSIASSRLSRALFSTTVDQAVLDKGIAYDDTSRDFLDNVELAHVLKTVATASGRPIDVLGFDACLMNMIEVAYELRQYATTMVGSEETEPADGWPYRDVAKAAGGAAAKTPGGLAAAIVKSYLAFYKGSSEETVTQSALDLSKVEPVARAVDQLATTLTTSLQAIDEYAAFSRALTAAQRFDLRDFVDLGDLCRQLAKRSGDQETIDRANVVITALTGRDGAVLASRTKGSAVAAATGAAIYFPTAGDVNLVYDRLAFAKDTRWPQLIQRYHSF